MNAYWRFRVVEESRSVLVGFWLYNGVSARLAVCEGKPIGGCGLRRRVGVWIVGRLDQQVKLLEGWGCQHLALAFM